MTSTPCPATEALEALALGHDPADEMNRHLANCPACRARLETLREENAFLHGFAIDGSLPAVTGEEDPLRNFAVPGYEILREIHRGGQGVVYQARQQSTRRDVALKVMRQGTFATRADRARFDREVETLGRLDHPNIVTVHDAGVVRGFHYVVMDFVDGHDLDDWADPRRHDPTHPRAPRDLVRLFVQVCDAVHAAHLRGVIHRDLKPSNIRVDQDGRPLVLDFGLAKTTDESTEPSMTRTGQFVGSLPWASPEQVEGSAEIDLRTDVYSLGVILFQLLTGQLPFPIDSNLRQTLDNILTREPTRPSLLAGQRVDSDELDTIVLKCLAKDRDRRYQSAGELAQDLRRHLAGDPIEAKRDSALYVLRKTLGRYRLRVAAAGALLLLTGIFAIIMTMAYRRAALLERQAVRNAESFAELLSQSRIEQGRLAGLLGNHRQAETLLWRELLTTRDTEGPTRLATPPGRADAWWALWDLHRTSGCLRTIPLPSTPRTASYSTRDRRFRTIDVNGQGTLLDLDGNATGLPPLETTPNAGLPDVHPSGRWALTITPTHYQLWRIGSPQPVLQRPHDEGPRGNATLSPDGSLLATRAAGQAALYRTDDFTEIARFDPDGPPLDALALSHDATRLATRDIRGRLTIWDIATRRILHQFPDQEAERTTPRAADLRFAPGDNLLVDAWIGGPGRIINLDRQPPQVIPLQESPGSYRVVAFDPTGRQLAVGDLDGTVRLFRTSDGARQRTFVAHDRIRSLGFVDRQTLWTSDESIRLWDLRTDAHQRVETIPGEPFLHTVAVAPDGSWIAVGGGTGQLRLRRRDAASAWQTIPIANPAVMPSIAIAPDGAALAAASYANTVLLWKLDDAGQVRAPDAPLHLTHPSRVSHVRFNTDGNRLVTACDDGQVRVWEAEDGQHITTLPCGSDRLPQVAIDPTGQHIAAARRDGGLLVWNVSAQNPRVAFWSPFSDNPLVLQKPGELPVRTVRFSNDGATLYSAGADHTIHLWSIPEGAPLASLAGHSHEIYCLDVSRDGSLLASGDAGGNVHVWDARGHRHLLTLGGHSGAVMAICFTPDGGLVTVSLDGSLRWWDLGFYRRHIAGQVDAQLRRLAPALAETSRAAAWRNWAARILAPSHPPPSP